jgi:hypothetical protein
MEAGAAVTWRPLTHNFGWKLASLALSVLLWFAIVGQPELVTTHTVPILYKNLPTDLLIGADALDSVRVELRGPLSKLTGPNLADLAMLLDLSSVGGPGERTFTLSDGDLNLPEGIVFLRAVPSQLRIRVARLLTKDVPVQIRIAAPPPHGYRIVRQKATPDQLRIAGPEQRVQQTGSAETDAIDLSYVTQTSEFHVSAFVADPQVRLESPPTVTVKMTIERTDVNEERK